MIHPEKFIKILKLNKINFVTGVPDSMFQSLCFSFEKNYQPTEHVTAANEGSAIGLAIGSYLSKRKIPLVYMQNSGIGNALNPIVSLAGKKIYKIPMILLIGWRGEFINKTQINDEPQHMHQGLITRELLKLLQISYTIIDDKSNVGKVFKKMKKIAEKTSAPVAILVRKNTFQKIKIKISSKKKPTREQVLKVLIKYIPSKMPKITTTGMLSREIYEINKKNKNLQNTFMCVGGMGHAISIATGIAKTRSKKKIFCLDGDGASLMHMGSMASSVKCKNLVHILFNNNSHDSVGGQNTAGHNLNFKNIAKSIGYSNTYKISKPKNIQKIIKLCLKNKNSSFVEINCETGHRNNLIRPFETPDYNKEIFMKFLNN